MKKLCCQDSEKGSVYFNPYNEVVQCHSCGYVFVPASKLQYKLNKLLNHKWWGKGK